MLGSKTKNVKEIKGGFDPLDTTGLQMQVLRQSILSSCLPMCADGAKYRSG